MTVVTPATIGGRFTNAYPWTGQPVIFSQDGGRRRNGGWVGSGSPRTVGSVTDDGSAVAESGTWSLINLSEGSNENTWNTYQVNNAAPNVYYIWNYTTGALEPHVSGPGFQPGESFDSSPIWKPNATFSGYFTYFDNGFAGAAAGPDWTSMRDPGNWIAVINQPPSMINPNTGNYYITDTGSIKTSVANQYNFTPQNVGVPISSFNTIRGYRNKINPGNPGNPGCNYDASWDLYGWAHTPPSLYATSLEVMFWTYWNGTQAPWNIQSTSTPYESGLEFGDGNVWDLYMTTDTAATGGVTSAYSYGIFCLHDVSGNGPAPATDVGWIDILTPLRYFVSHYVVTSGGAAANPLDIPIWQIIEGWEMASSNYAPVQFTHLDGRLEMT
jgi:hypothetical protein